jgi:hypothetical protein
MTRGGPPGLRKGSGSGRRGGLMPLAERVGTSNRTCTPSGEVTLAMRAGVTSGIGSATYKIGWNARTGRNHYPRSV